MPTRVSARIRMLNWCPLAEHSIGFGKFYVGLLGGLTSAAGSYRAAPESVGDRVHGLLGLTPSLIGLPETQNRVGCGGELLHAHVR